MEVPLPQSGPLQPLSSVQLVVPPPELPAPNAADTASPEPTAPALTYQRLIKPDEANGGNDVCLVFSAELDPALSYHDFISVPDQHRPLLRVEGGRLCVLGLPLGHETILTLKAGLPGRDGGTLAAEQSVSVLLGDRPPQVSFGSGFILPRQAGDGLPVTTINVPSLEMKLYRVGDRLLARMRQDLVDEKTVYAYRTDYYANDEGRLVWSGPMAIKESRNQTVTSLFPLVQAMGKPEPGVYLLTAQLPRSGLDAEDEYYDYRGHAAQWVVHSDLGLTSFRGGDGLTLSVRGLGDAKPKAGVRLTLIARNNDELTEVITDAQGMAHFAPGLLRGEGGMTPVMVMAYDGDDFNFLDLRRPEFDLSDRGVQGRDPSGPVDAFLYADRGIYRPGESVQLTALLRDADVRTVAASPIFVLLRPDGREYRRFTSPDKGQAGAHHLTMALPKSANRGVWRVNALMDPKGAPVGTLTFDVQDFVPQRLALDLPPAPTVLRPGQALDLPLAARFLYGAPAAGLGGEAELVLEADPNPFPRHKGFQWGVEGATYDGQRLTLAMDDTDEAGHTKVTGSVPSGLDSPMPLRAVANIAVREPGGRTTSDRLTMPVAWHDVSLGLRPRFEGAVRTGQDAVFDLLAVNDDGEAVAADKVEIRLYKDTSTWQWYRADGSWRYQRVPHESQVATGLVDIGEAAPAEWRRNLNWGRYRLEIRKDQAVTSRFFTVGWYGNAGPDRPDRLQVGADKPGYQPGDKARIRVQSDLGGPALLVVANEKVRETRVLTLAPGDAEIELEMRPEWGPGVYAMVTLYRPLAGPSSHAPVRAVGVSWLGLDPGLRTLKVDIDAPETITPRQKLEVAVKVTGGDKAFVTLAAVDQGILQLTRFKTPAPAGHYLVQRRLGVGMRDDYGRLIRGLPGQGDDQGGDAMGRGLDVVPTKTVALFSGVVAVKDGVARIPLDIPDFQGELRLMAVAFDGAKVGSGDRRLTVRDPVVAEMILPRFLAPDDHATATLLLHNVGGQAGDYQIKLSSQGPVTLAETRTETLAAGERRMLALPITAGEMGIADMRMQVSGPGNFAVSRSWPIQVRPARVAVTDQQTVTLAAGAKETLDDTAIAGYLPGTVKASLNLSRWQGLDVPGLLRWMDRYPFGCLEQTTSRALPLLYFNDLAQAVGAAGDQGADARIQQAIDRVLTMQGADGNFRMWGPWGVDAYDWLSVYALDFLDRAAAKKFDVPQAALNAGRRWLASSAFTSSNPEVKAYAAALLARAGKVNAADLRYFHDVNPPANAIALAHLGAALDAIGERDRAARSFDRAVKALAVEPWKYKPLLYGSQLRDAFAVAAILAESGRGALVPEVLAQAGQMNAQAEMTTTQDKAWMLLAAAALGKNTGQVAVKVDGRMLEAKGDPLSLPVELARLTKGISVENAGGGDIFRTLSVDGVPSQPQQAEDHGVVVRKRILGLDGQPVDVAQVKRNDRLVVVLSLAVRGERKGDYAVLDLLPAGLEPEGMVKPGQPGFGWLTDLSSPQTQELGDDRFLAIQSLPRYVRGANDPEWQQGKPVYDATLAYVVRAVGLGEFALPGVIAEHMYSPGLVGRTAEGRLVIGE
ncbi:MAG: alpha-2-macroglobulin family protein [Magnetospirillum sp.]|nr:alpha-2-macroglobulin family protein [Magnetospirillum sp.]